ncbi:MAG: methane monooxygenase/ammonia monooxygenase subunit C, partial [Cycloclasticus sp.]
TVGYNEWGHAFWLMEEYFTVPLHWGFVFFGWSILALAGLLNQIIKRMIVIMPKVVNEKGELTS